MSWMHDFQSNQRIAVAGDLILQLLSRLLDLVQHLLAGHLDLEAARLLRIERELVPRFGPLIGLLLQEVVIEIVLAVGVGCKVALIHQVLLDFAEVLGEVAEVIGLEGVCLEVDRLIACCGWFLGVVSEGVEHFLLLLGGWSWSCLSSACLCCRLREGLKIKSSKISKITVFGLWLGAAGKVSELRKWVCLLLLVKTSRASLFCLIPRRLIEDLIEVPIIDPHFKLIDIVWRPGDAKDMSINLMHEVEVDVEDTT